MSDNPVARLAANITMPLLWVCAENGLDAKHARNISISAMYGIGIPLRRSTFGRFDEAYDNIVKLVEIGEPPSKGWFTPLQVLGENNENEVLMRAGCLAITHYCAAFNIPHMTAREIAKTFAEKVGFVMQTSEAEQQSFFDMYDEVKEEPIPRELGIHFDFGALDGLDLTKEVDDGGEGNPYQ